MKNVKEIKKKQNTKHKQNPNYKESSMFNSSKLKKLQVQKVKIKRLTSSSRSSILYSNKIGWASF